VKRIALIGGLIGFINCVFAILLVFITFNASEEEARTWINPTLWILAPPVIWTRLAMPDWMMFLLPFVNAGLYAAVATILGALFLVAGPPFLVDKIELRWPRRKILYQRRQQRP
jgi:hypothetical protein